MIDDLNKNYLDTYEIIEELGRSDLTIVYRARRKSDGREMALKAVAPHFTFDELFVRRFKDAARRAISLDHPNIVHTYEVGEREGILYLVTDLARGEKLAEVLAREGSLSLSRAVNIVRQIAAVLDFAHAKAINHGDLSDQTVYLGNDDAVTIADFGEAQSAAGTSLVKQGFAVGTPAYLAPERVHGQGPSRAADLYALGVLAYQMLAGQPPFTGAPVAVLHAQAYEQPIPLHLVNPNIPVAVSETVARMLSKGMELRHSTGAEFARALQAAAEGSAPVRKTVQAAPPTTPITPVARRRFYQRFAFWAFVITPLIGLLLAAGFWGVIYWNSQQAQIASTRAARPSPVPTFSVQEEVIAPTPAPPPTDTPAPTASPTASPLPPTATMPPLPTPGEPVVVADSPFTNLRLAHRITEDNQPDAVGTHFAPGPQPIYLFFDYQGIQPGTPWSHTWTWADQILETGEGEWPEDFGSAGTAWVFYSPADGYENGPYQVTLAVEGRTVATATFIIAAGGQ